MIDFKKQLEANANKFVGLKLDDEQFIQSVDYDNFNEEFGLCNMIIHYTNEKSICKRKLITLGYIDDSSVLFVKNYLNFYTINVISKLKYDDFVIQMHDKIITLNPYNGTIKNINMTEVIF